MKEILIGLLSAILTAAGVIAAASFGYFNKDRELDIEMVRVSLNILSGDVKDSSDPGRRFALRTLSKYSGIDIPDPDFDLWVKSGTIPKPIVSPDLCGNLATVYVEALKNNSPLSVGEPTKSLMKSFGCFVPDSTP